MHVFIINMYKVRSVLLSLFLRLLSLRHVAAGTTRSSGGRGLCVREPCVRGAKL